MAKTIRLIHGYFALVDDEDFERFSKASWYLIKKSRTLLYARNRSGAMHRQILGITDRSIEVDHKNGNGLDNRKQNLRICTRSENMRNLRNFRNTSGYKGVHWKSRDKRWRAQICTAGKQLYLGNYDDPIKAAKAYDEAARKHHGKYACTNEMLGLLRVK